MVDKCKDAGAVPELVDAVDVDVITVGVSLEVDGVPPADGLLLAERSGLLGKNCGVSTPLTVVVEGSFGNDLEPISVSADALSEGCKAIELPSGSNFGIPGLSEEDIVCGCGSRLERAVVLD